jgi:FtsH-binding integral membrane protein
MEENMFLMILVFIANIASAIAIMCCGMGRKVPHNYILLSVFTFTEAYLVAFIASAYTPETVGIAAFMTTGMVLGLVVFAWRTDCDFTSWGPYLMMFGFAFAIFSLFAMLFASEIMNTFICLVGVVFFGIYLIYDIQIIVGGKQYQLSKEDYIIGSLILYIDIIQIFLYILRLIGEKK